MCHRRATGVVDGQIDGQCKKRIGESVICCGLRREQVAKINGNVSLSKFTAYEASIEDPSTEKNLFVNTPTIAAHIMGSVGVRQAATAKQEIKSNLGKIARKRPVKNW